MDDDEMRERLRRVERTTNAIATMIGTAIIIWGSDAIGHRLEQDYQLPDWIAWLAGFAVVLSGIVWIYKASDRETG